MADLGNSKIKDTYTLVLQTDAGGNLQNLDGTTPSPFIVNGNLRYIDGNQSSNYVLTSDAVGNASWTEAGGTSYWSANTDGSISPSGLTTNIGIGTSTPNTPLTVVGDISGTTDLYLGSSTHTASTITAQEELIIKGNGLNDYIRLSNDFFAVWMDAAQELVMTPTETTFNASSRAVDFGVNSEDGTLLIRTRAEHNIVRLLDHVSINKPTGWNWDNEQQQALAVSGTSVFYSGGTSHNSEAIVAIGNISGTTDLYLGDSVHTASTITAQEQLIIRGRGADNDFMTLKEDTISFSLDGTESIEFTSPTEVGAGGTGLYLFNASSNDYDFKIVGENATPIFNVTGSENRIRVRDHLTIGDNSAISHSDAVNWGLAVTGSSLFYSGGTSHNTEAIVAIGNISGTTDLYIDGNMYSGTTNLLDIFASSGITNQDVYWSATTDGDITTSGNTDVRISGNTYVSGDTHTTNLILAADGYIMPAASSNTIKMRAQTYDGEMVSIGPDLFNVNMNSAANLTITPTQVTFNAVGIDQDFQILTDSGAFSVQNNAEYNLLALSNAGGTSIGGTTSRWPTANGQPNTSANQTLLVNGITTIYSGGPETYSWSGDTTALRVAGNISGETDLHIGGITTSIGGFVGDITGNADTATKIASITNANIVQLDETQTLTNKTLTTPVITSISNSGTVTVPTGADTLVARTSTDTLTNKTLSAPVIGMGTNKITGLGNPTAAQDAVTKAYVDGLDHVDYWSANTDGSISTSGVTNVKISGNTEIAGTLNVDGTITGDLTGNADTVTNGVYTTNNLSVMATTTSAQLAGVISNISGSGDLLFGTSPIITTPTVHEPTTRFVEADSSPVGSTGGSDIVVNFGTVGVTTIGNLYIYNTLGGWTLASAAAVGTSTGLLGIALGSLSSSGMLIRGMVTTTTFTPSIGLPIYMSATNGLVTVTSPTTSGNIVRVLGYSINALRCQIWFNPDNTWVELT